MTRPALVPSAVLAAVAAPDSTRGLLRPSLPVASGTPAQTDGTLAERAAEVIDRLGVRREFDLPAGTVEDALRFLPDGAAVPAAVPGRDELVRLTADALHALGELLEPGDPLRASLMIAARGPRCGDAGDTFDEQTPQEWQRRAWRLAVALLLTAGSAAGGALDGRAADAIQSATGMIAALAVVDVLWPRRPRRNDDTDTSDEDTSDEDPGSRG